MVQISFTTQELHALPVAPECITAFEAVYGTKVTLNWDARTQEVLIRSKLRRWLDTLQRCGVLPRIILCGVDLSGADLFGAELRGDPFGAGTCRLSSGGRGTSAWRGG